MEIPITQSKEWQKLQEDLDEKSVFVSNDKYQYLGIIKKTPVGKYLYCPYGPVAKDKKAFELAIDSLINYAKKEKLIFVRIEPQETDYLSVLAKGVTRVTKTNDLNPKDTWILDLTPDKESIVSGFSQGTRTRYNNYAKKGLSVESTRNCAMIAHLVDLQSKLFKEKGINSYSKEYLEAELRQPFASLYLVRYHQPNDEKKEKSDQKTKPQPSDNQIIAASLFFDHDGTRYYMQSAADQEYRHLPATVALLTSAIFDAKEKGIKRFDFWGIAPDGASNDHPWAGFTEFKKSFGGAARHHAGTYDLIIRPIVYQKYKLLRSVNMIKRRRK